MWQRFTQEARKVVFYSQEEALRNGKGNVAPEHLLLGLLREADGTCCDVLTELGLNRDAIRAEVEALLPSAGVKPTKDMALTSRAKRVIDLAYKSARSLKNDFIGAEHLLMGLIREEKGIPAHVFKNLKVGFADMEQAVIAVQAREGVKAAGASRISMTPALGYTARAQAIVRYAREVAREIGEGHISTEHLLLGSIADPTGSAAAILDRLGVAPEALRAEIDRRTAAYRGHTWHAHLLPRVQRVLELVKEEVQADDAELIGTSHYLLALIREEHGVAAKALRKLGVTQADVREVRDDLRAEANADTPPDP